MKTCPDCHAPNPERLTKCYACGVRLDARPRAAPLPGEGTYPCANCSGPIPLHLTECPHCGRVGEPPPVALDAEVPKSPMRFIEPPGWSRSDLPDGTVLLTRRAGSRAIQDWSSALGGASVATCLLGFGLASFALRLHSPPLISVAALPFFGIFVLLLSWWIFGREGLRLGGNWLERRVGLGRWQRFWRVSDAALVVQSRETRGRYRDEEWFDLVATGRGGSVRLATGMVPIRTAALFGLDTEPRRAPSELVFFTEVVAGVTGWNVTAI